MGEPKLNKKVYLLSEDQTDLKSLQRLIRDKGFQLICDGVNGEIIHRIRRSHPDIIFLDIQNIDLRENELLDDLRDNIETKHTPIYLLKSGNGTHKKMDYESRIEVVEEPFDSSEVHSILESILEPDIGIKFWGVRGSTPCANKENIEYGGNTTCVQIELPSSDEFLILDSGTGIRNLGNYINSYRENVKGHIFITHPHWDHIQGFPFFKPIYNPKNHFDIHMPPQVNGGCREILSGHLTKTFFPVTLEMIDANLKYITQTEDRQSYGEYEVEYMLANHPINTAIYKIHVGGKQIVFCPDNELTPIDQKTNAFFYTKLKEFFYEVDLLIHDGQYNRKNYPDKVGWGHSAWEESVDFAIRSKVKNLYLTHHDPDSNDKYLADLDEKLTREFGDYFESIQLAKEGVKVRIETQKAQK